MIRKHIYFTEESLNFLEDLVNPQTGHGLSLSEHTRRAIDEYIQKIKAHTPTSISPSKGGKNG